MVARTYYSLSGDLVDDTNQYGSNGFTGASNDQNNGGQVFDYVDDGLTAIERIRCLIKPTAPGCYPTQNTPNTPPPAEKDQTWLIVGVGVVILLVILIIVIALKK